MELCLHLGFAAAAVAIAVFILSKTAFKKKVSPVSGKDITVSSSKAEEVRVEETFSIMDMTEEARLSQEEAEIVMTDTSGDWRLILVNPTHKLPEDYPVDTVRIWEGEVERVDYRIYDATKAMLNDCERAGNNPVVRGAFRTQRQQEELYEAKVEDYMADGDTREEALKNAATVVALPGTSEHQLGLALDIVDVSYNILNSDQAYSSTQRWLMEHCWEYGFVLRYPTDKGKITGIIYEPWHYRYVGKEAAKVMQEENLCLEEYLEKYGNGGAGEDDS